MKNNSPIFSAPIHVHWELTHICAFDCLQCYQREDRKRPILSEKEHKTIARKIIDGGVFQVTTTGGEPFSVPYLLELIEEFLNNNLTVRITSSGAYLTDDIVKKIARLDVPVQISLDSNERDKHDFIRGKKGAYDIAINSIKTLKKYGVNVSMAFCAMNRNSSDLQGVVKLAHFLGVNQVLVGDVIQELQGLRSKIGMNYKEYNDFVNESISIKEKYKEKVDVSLNFEWGFIVNDNVDHAPCSALDRDFSIFPDGDAYPCPFIRNPKYKIGNIIQQEIKDIWFSDLSQYFRRNKFLGCNAEECNKYPICKSGCKASLANIGKPINQKDPKCILYHK